MKRIVLGLFSFLILTGGVFAQVSINPGSIVLEAENESQIFIEIYIANSGTEPIDLYWTYEPDENYPDTWKSQICDLNLCYLWDELNSSPSLPNVVTPGKEVLFTLKVANNIAEGDPISGSSCGVLRLFSDADKTNEVAFTTCTTSTNDLDLDDLVIYPNPTSETFQIKNDASVSSISVYNIVGRLVKTFDHSEGMIHDVTALRSGMYLVRLEDKKGETLKSMRLSKR